MTLGFYVEGFFCSKKLLIHKLMNLLEEFVIHVSIDLCRRDRRVSEQCLDRSDVGSFFEKSCSK